MQFLFDMHNDTVKCQIKQYPKEHGIDQIWDFKSNDFCCWADLPDLQANCIKKIKNHFNYSMEFENKSIISC